MRISVLILLITLAHLIRAQGYLLPFLQDGKYGICDEAGNLIIEPIYEAAIPSRGLYIFKVKQNGVWGFVNLKNEVILPITMGDAQPKDQHYFHRKGPWFRRAINKHAISKVEGAYEKAHLYEVYDGSKAETYYVNPFVPGSVSGPYPNFYKSSKKDESFSNAANTGLTRVLMPDHMINFIDTAGHLVFTQGIYDGHAISPAIILVKHEDGRNALYNINSRRQTAFEKQEVRFNFDYHFFIIEKTEVRGPMISSLLDLHGNVIMEGFQGEIRMRDNLAILEKPDTSSIIINTKGDTLFTCHPCQLSFVVQDLRLIRIRKQEKIGIIDTVGNTIIEVKYDDLDLNYVNEWEFVRGQSSGVLDEDYVEKWVFDSVRVKRKFSDPDLYFLVRGSPRKELFGLADAAGHMLLPPIFSEIKPYFDAGCMRVAKDTLYGVVDLQGRYIVPLMDTMIVIKTSNVTPGHYSTRPVFVYDATNKSVSELTREAPVKLLESKKGEFQITDVKGNPLTSKVYKHIFRVNDLSVPRAIFIGEDPETKQKDVLNEQGKSILPTGYTIAAMQEDLVTKAGLVTVYNIKDVEELTNLNTTVRYRSGVIDPDGKWVLGPDYMYTRVIRQQYIMVTYFDHVGFALHDKHGKLISRNTFLPLENSHGDAPLKYDQLVFGKPVDSLAFMQFLTAFYKAKSGADIKKLSEEYLPDFVEGSLDFSGKEVVAFEYKDVADFQHPFSTTKSRDGKFSTVIDAQGKEVLRTSYAELTILEKDSTLIKFKVGTQYGLMDISGRIIIGPKYYDIYKDTWLGQYILFDSVSTYVAPYQNPEMKTRIGPVGSVQFWKSDHCYRTELRARSDISDKRYYHSFEADGTPLKAFEGFFASEDFMDARLPIDYISISDSRDGPVYVINTRTGVKYKNPD